GQPFPTRRSSDLRGEPRTAHRRHRRRREGPLVKTTAAVVHEAGKPLEIEELDLEGPGEGEVLVRFTHAGLCHSDLHVMQGEIAGWLPMVLGHEGAGVVEDVGPGVTRVAPGDHVVCSFVPSCGSCHW